MELTKLKTTWRLTIGEHSMYLRTDDMEDLYRRLRKELMDVLPVGDGGEELLAKAVVPRKRRAGDAVLTAADRTDAVPWTGMGELRRMAVGETKVFVMKGTYGMRKAVTVGVCNARTNWGYDFDVYHKRKSDTWTVVRKS